MEDKIVLSQCPIIWCGQEMRLFIIMFVHISFTLFIIIADSRSENVQ